MGEPRDFSIRECLAGPHRALSCGSRISTALSAVIQIAVIACANHAPRGAATVVEGIAVIRLRRSTRRLRPGSASSRPSTSRQRWAVTSSLVIAVRSHAFSQ